MFIYKRKYSLVVPKILLASFAREQFLINHRNHGPISHNMANDTSFILWQCKTKRLKYPLFSLWNESAVMTGQIASDCADYCGATGCPFCTNSQIYVFLCFPVSSLFVLNRLFVWYKHRHFAIVKKFMWLFFLAYLHVTIAFSTTFMFYSNDQPILHAPG